MQDRDDPQAETDQTAHERRVADVEGTERGADDVDPIAGSDRRPTPDEDLAADRDEPDDDAEDTVENRGWQHQPPEDLGR
jgi:hypothetical protein